MRAFSSLAKTELAAPAKLPKNKPAARPKTAAVAQATNTLHLSVVSARAWVPAGLANGASIPQYQWLIVKDDSGDHTRYPGSETQCKPPSLGGDPEYPDNCQWPSIHEFQGGAQDMTPGSDGFGSVVAQGNETNLNATAGINLPPGKYMISVTAGGFTVPGCIPSGNVTCTVEGFKIDGNWFTVPLSQPGADPGLVTVQMQPYPLPLTTLRIMVFSDTSTNGEFDTGETGLAGWEAHISDVLDEVTTDWFGNPLCTTYQHDVNGNIIFDADGRPVIAQTGGRCVSDANGIVEIKYLGPNRYSSQVIPPNGEVWYQTTTLEGGLDWDIWANEGWNGNDPEFVPTSEAFPFAIFGYIQPTSLAGQPTMPTTGGPQYTGQIKGTIVRINPYTPPVNGIAFGVEGGFEIAGPVDRPIVMVVDMLRNDQIVWAGRGNPDGTFNITGVQDGDYLVGYVDLPENYLVESVLTKVVNGQVTDLRVLYAFPWFTSMFGKVCNDTNRNGKCDPGEPGIPGIPVQRLQRDNTLADQGANTATTDANGNYSFTQLYPYLFFTVLQVYDERFYTVGITYQTNNQPAETTVMANGGFVDISTLDQVGLTTRFDWALHAYESDPALGPTNGGIVGTVYHAATRNELDARFQANEDYEGAIPGLNVHIYAPVSCAPGTTGCVQTTTPFGTSYYLTNSDGSYTKGPELNDPITTERWLRPINCVARGAGGVSVPQQLLPDPNSGTGCLEAPLMSNQVGNNSLADINGVEGRGQFVNGNYGITTITTNTLGVAIPETEIPPGDYIVEVQSPLDAFTGKPAVLAVKEEDINVFSGDIFVAPGETPVNPPLPQIVTQRPQPTPQIPPFICTGPKHTVHVVDDPALALWDPLDPANPAKTGVFNPDFLDAGGSPYEGVLMPLCNARLVTVQARRSATPNFFFFTPVPLPGRIYGLVTDDLNVTTDPKELYYGEKRGIPNIPIGIYDFTNRLLTTIHTDPNGRYEVILPSTSSYNCPLPAGPCPGVYRFVANDRGQPGRPNPNHNPQYRSLSIFQQVWPGITLNSDLAPLPVATAVESPGQQDNHPAACVLNDPAQPAAPKVPELYAVSPAPYVNGSGSFTIRGQYFGASQGSGNVTLGNITLPVTSWSDRQIDVTVPAGTPVGAHQLLITASNGQKTINGLTFHVLGTGYQPTLFEVGPGKPYDPATDPDPFNSHAIQRAVDAAAAAAQALVVVYPGPLTTWNPLGVYYESLIIHSPVKLQGVGPGGVYADGSYVLGSVMDGFGFGQDNAKTTDWQVLLASLLPFVMPAQPPAFVAPTGAVILVLAKTTTQFTSAYKASIDGLTIQGGDQLDFVAHLNEDGGGPQLGLFDPIDPFFTFDDNVQGGAIATIQATRHLQITNNVIHNNSGSYGTIRIGQSYTGDTDNDGLRIAQNRIVANGGSNLAGAIGIFAGADQYEVDHNDICGNFSAEYGGGISHFGLSAFGKIHDNRIYFNGSYDEGAGIMIAGEFPLPPGALQRVFDDVQPPPPPPAGLSPGAGPVDIYNNLIQGNVSGDDGGGLRFLMAGAFEFNVYNNIIANNIATHEGGGVSLDDAPNVRFFNNTVIKNLTTSTSISSDGLPKPAGLSTQLNSVNLQNFLVQNNLPGAGVLYSNPLQFNNTFCDNRAGRWDGANIIGIGYVNVAGQTDPNPINYWDMGSIDNPANLLQPTNSILQPTSNPGVQPDASNQACPSDLSTLIADSTYNVSILALPWRGDARFVGNVNIARDVPITIMGNYHLVGASAIANNAGAASKSGVNAPTFDIDNQGRPSDGGFEIGADELPATPFPATSILDDFNRTPPGGLLGSNWAGDTAPGFFRIDNNQVQVRQNGSVWWNAATFGARQEAFFTFTKVVPSATEQALLLKFNGTAPASANAQWIEVLFNATTSSVVIQTKDPSQGVVQRGTISGVTFANGNQFGARAFATGVVIVYKNGTPVGSTNVATGPTPWPAANVTGGGKIGVKFTGVSATNDARFDNFGGGTLP